MESELLGHLVRPHGGGDGASHRVSDLGDEEDEGGDGGDVRVDDTSLGRHLKGDGGET